jgi:phosphate transport system permease protein
MTSAPVPTDWRSPAMAQRLHRRHVAERRFRRAGATAVTLSAAFLAFLLIVMLGQGLAGFTRTTIRLPLDPRGAVTEASVDALATRAYGPDGPALLADQAWRSVRAAAAHGRTAVRVPAADAIDAAYNGTGTPAAEARVRQLRARGVLDSEIALPFFTGADATDPVRAGIWGALKGSLLTMAVTLAVAMPVGVFAALWLEEFAPRRRWTDVIEVSINNLAAVPSIIFGLLGLALFLGTLGLPRSAPLVGGLTLALMTMPVIVIAGRNAIKGVPPSVREAALAVGASPVQVVFHHVLPLALPGILTGAIIGMARALGETAPLLLIGMRAFIAAPPGGIEAPATVLPVQIFLWSDEVSHGFVEKTSAAIVVLLLVLLLMNGAAVWLRDRFEARR